MRTAHEWLNEYGDSHQNSTNEMLHWVCVPVIEWCVVALLWITPFPFAIHATYPEINWATLALLAAVVYYLFLSRNLALGSLVLLLCMLWSVDVLDHAAHSKVWMIAVGLFVLAWIGQFIGHAIEGKRPSFFKDLQFLLIGPIWLLSNLYRRLGISI
jgi:uncharacterized membrane protein YGL010W